MRLLSIQALSRHRRSIAVLLAILLATLVADLPAHAGSGADSPIRISNQGVHIEGEIVVITYDIEAPEGTPCAVTVELRKESDPSFSLSPKSLTGDFGELKSAGAGRTIRWEYLKDFPAGFRGEDYYFRIEAVRPGGFPWFWVGLGTAAAVGATVVLFSGKATSAGTPAGPQQLPMPPAR
ncbi:MAG TPA: hypothetical protein VL221_15335 [Bacteroidota bacterium]|nr:hypothetical protein [Bacteroidota bacterium]